MYARERVTKDAMSRGKEETILKQQQNNIKTGLLRSQDIRGRERGSKRRFERDPSDPGLGHRGHRLPPRSHRVRSQFRVIEEKAEE